MTWKTHQINLCSLKATGFLVVALFLSGSCNQGNKSNTRQELPETDEMDGWINLFDGETFDGWRTLGSDSVFTAFWKIEDGILKKTDRGKVQEQADGQPLQGGDLMTIEAFDDFELYWEWALWENGNSGLKYNVSEEISMSRGSRHSALGFEYQMIDDNGEEYTGLKPAQFSGSLYDLFPAHDVSLKSYGQFNSSRIRIEGSKVTHWLNGKEVLSYSFGSPELLQAYENSKFSDITGFIKKHKGHIVLQDHITEAWFRNIRIKKL